MHGSKKPAFSFGTGQYTYPKVLPTGSTLLNRLTLRNMSPSPPTFVKSVFQTSSVEQSLVLGNSRWAKHRPRVGNAECFTVLCHNKAGCDPEKPCIAVRHFR